MDHLNRRIEAYWDARSELMSETRRLELDGVDGIAWKNFFKRNLPVGRLKILDIGTGAGFFAAILSKLGHKVIGVDISTKMLVEAEKNLREMNLAADFRKMNAQKLDFASETFDALVTRNLTWTLPDIQAAYREWRRVLKIGGVLMNFDSDYGEKDFSACSTTKISSNQLEECSAIKNSLKISTYRRPMWDASFLEGINFSVRLEEDISPVVQKDSRCAYDSVPLFAIHARKKNFEKNF